jgi:hypothetical protein
MYPRARRYIPEHGELGVDARRQQLTLIRRVTSADRRRIPGEAGEPLLRPRREEYEGEQRDTGNHEWQAQLAACEPESRRTRRRGGDEADR